MAVTPPADMPGEKDTLPGKILPPPIAEEGRGGEVLSYGSINNTSAALSKLLKKLGKDGTRRPGLGIKLAFSLNW